MIKKELLAYSLLVIQPIFMASNLVVARGGVEYIPPISLAFWRWLTVFLILLIFNYTIFSKKKIILKEYKKLFFLGFMGCGVCGAFPFIAGQTTTIINMGIIYTSSPIFIILISYFFFKEKMSLLKIIGLISCLLGVIIIIIKGDYLALIELMFTKGDLWMLGASIGWALYSIFLFYWKSSLKVFERFTLISLFGALSLLPFYLTEEIFIKSTTFDTNFIIWVIFAAVSPGLIAFSLYTYAQRYLGATTTGFTLYLFTVYGAFYGILFFGENLKTFHVYGTVLVFLGVYLVKYKKKMYKKISMIILNSAIALTVIYLVVVIVIFLSQRKLMYHPNENNYLEENQLNHKIEKVYINSDFKLLGWHHVKNKKFKTLLFFHGNAGNLQNRIYKLNDISKLDLNYLIIAYRGFSGNKGEPNEIGLYKDSESAKKWLNNIGVSDKDIILYGESLGTAVAVDLASKHNFAGIILESPFTSMVKLSKIYYPYLPVKILLKDKYESIKKIDKINFPKMVMHGDKDKIVPFSMGKEMFEKFSEPKLSYFRKGDDHMMEFDEELLEKIKNFLKII